MPDVGSYFDKLAKRGRGGRRLEPNVARTPSSASTRARAGNGTGGSLLNRVKDALGKTRGKPSAPPGGRTATVTIEYSPSIDGDPDPGEVVWTWVPFEEDPTQGKDRPVVIIGRRNSNLVGVPLTTKADDREAQVAVGRGGWDPERRVSYARIWRLLDVDEQRMRREGAILERARFDAVTAAVDDYYDVTYPAGTDRQAGERSGSARRTSTGHA